MKKFLAIVTIGAFMMACNNGKDEDSATYSMDKMEDSANLRIDKAGDSAKLMMEKMGDSTKKMMENAAGKREN